MRESLLDESRWPAMPERHRGFLRTALARLREDPRLLGVAAGGSFAGGVLDAHSDLDLVVVAEPDRETALRAGGPALAATLGPLLAAFTGEHVGEPRLLICLYGPPLLHVDLKLVGPDALAQRSEDPVVLWDRRGALARALAASEARPVCPDLQWIEDRFWVWVHYLVGKIARGELFDVLDGLAFLRGRVLGPLCLVEAGAPAHGLRRVEQLAPERLPALRGTLAGHDPASCRAALAASIDLYTALRARLAPESLTFRREAEEAARAFFAEEG